MNPWLTVASAIGLPTIITVLVNSLDTRRRLGAETDKLGTEATKIITDAASGVVEVLNKDNARLRLELVDCMARCARLEKHLREWGEWADQATAAVMRGDKNFRKPRPRLRPPPTD
jgi:hypothetical protein